MKPLQNQYPLCKSCVKEFNPNAKEGDRKCITDMCIECIHEPKQEPDKKYNIPTQKEFEDACLDKSPIPKKPTSIEEAAVIANPYTSNKQEGEYDGFQVGFIAGAKWMQEQFKQEKK